MKSLYIGKIILKMIDYLLIPMAGEGKRFKEVNFKTIKPMITIGSQTILEKSLKDMSNFKKKIIILKKEVYQNNNIIKKILKKLKLEKFILNKSTLGQSDTIYKLKNIVPKEKSILVHSCDYIMKFYLNKNKSLFFSSDAIVFVYKLQSRIVKDYKSFAYCKVDKNKNKILEIKEKILISNEPHNDFMAVGTFWFKRMQIFTDMHEAAIKSKNTVNGEYYIANNINLLINQGYKVSFLEVDNWINLGDFFDYNQYLYYENFFYKNKNILEC